MSSIEDFALYYSQTSKTVPMLEGYAGTDVVEWHGRVERQLQGYIREFSEVKNHEYTDKLREFLRIWRDNQLTGSINIETVNTLLASADLFAVDGWKLQDYFSHLRDNLRKLKASAEELPVLPPGEEPEGGPEMSPRGAPRGVTPGEPSQDFGPQREAPGTLDQQVEQPEEAQP